MDQGHESDVHAAVNKPPGSLERVLPPATGDVHVIQENLLFFFLRGPSRAGLAPGPVRGAAVHGADWGDPAEWERPSIIQIG